MDKTNRKQLFALANNEYYSETNLHTFNEGYVHTVPDRETERRRKCTG